MTPRQLSSFAILCAACAAASWGFPPRSARAEDRELAKLVADLGSAEWQLRESAHRRIVEEGPPVAGLLEAAAGSANPELAHRARQILALIDPRLVECSIIKVDLREPVHAIAMALAAGHEGEEMVVKLAPLPRRGPARAEEAPSYPEEPSLSITCQLLDGGRMAVAGARVLPGGARLPLEPLVLGARTIGILMAGELCRQTRMGLQIERERHPFITLVWTRQGRKSFLQRPGTGATADDPLDSIISLALEQASSGDAGEKEAGLDILSRLRVREPADALRAAAGIAPTSLLAALVGDDADSIAAALESAPTAGPAENALRIRAAERLLQKGDARGLEPLLAKLAEGDPSQLHEAAAALADHSRRPGLPEAQRRKIFDTVFSADVLGHLLWEDVESEHLLAAAIDLVTDAGPISESEVLKAAGLVEALPRGELGPVKVRIRTCLDIWRRLARKLRGSRQSETAFLLSVLPGLKSPTGLSEAIQILEESLQSGASMASAEPGEPAPGPGELGEQALTRVLEAILGQIQSGDGGQALSGFQALLRVSRAVSLRPGQLRRLVEAHITAAEAALEGRVPATADMGRPIPQVNTYLRQMDEQVSRWTGQSPRASSNAGRLFRVDHWKSWLLDEAAVAAREAANLRGKEPDSRAEAVSRGDRLVYFEFDFLLEGSRTRPATGAPASTRVLDGRRLEVEPFRPTDYEDRWGNRLRLRVERDSSATGQPARFRVNSRLSLSSAIPMLTGVQGKDLSVTWHETSGLFLGSRAVQGSGGDDYRTMLYIAPLGAETPGPPPAAMSDPALLWTWFLESHLLRLPDTPSPQLVNSLLSTLRALRIRECAPLLRKLLNVSEPTEIAQHQRIDIAKQLFELGDGEGIEFLRSELASATPLSRLLAAAAVCELGLVEGIQALIKCSREHPTLVQNHGSRVVRAVDLFLQAAKDDPAGRAAALEFLIARLHETNFYQQGAFGILQREAGTDFGYEAARHRTKPESDRALGEAVNAARAWWKVEAEKARSPRTPGR